MEDESDLRIGFKGYEKMGHIFIGLGKPWQCVVCDIMFAEIIKLDKWPDCKDKEKK